MHNTVLDALFAYFDSCPLMEGGTLNVDWLPEKPGKFGAYAIATAPTDEVIKRYLGGGAHCRYPFIISSVEDYGEAVAQNLLNSGFFEKLAEWLRKQSRQRKLPDLPPYLTPRSIRAIGPGYLYQPEAKTGKYQIQCELEYYRKGER